MIRSDRYDVFDPEFGRQAPDPFVPYAIAAVKLEQEQMVVLGQVVSGLTVDDLKVGMPMELVLETLHETEEDIKVTWKWQPLAS